MINKLSSNLVSYIISTRIDPSYEGHLVSTTREIISTFQLEYKIPPNITTTDEITTNNVHAIQLFFGQHMVDMQAVRILINKSTKQNLIYERKINNTPINVSWLRKMLANICFR